MASIPPSGNGTLMALGMFAFSLESLPFAEFQRLRDWRHAKAERHLARPAAQFLGPGEDRITLQGSFPPGVAGDYASMARLTEMAASGDAWPLVDGAGTVLGNFRIVKIDERRQHIVTGGMGRMIDFAVDLERAD